MKNIVIIGSVNEDLRRNEMDIVKEQLISFFGELDACMIDIIAPIDGQFVGQNLSIIHQAYFNYIVNADLIVCLPKYFTYSTDCQIPRKVANYEVTLGESTDYEVTLARALGKPIIYIDPFSNKEMTKLIKKEDKKHESR